MPRASQRPSLENPEPWKMKVSDSEDFHLKGITNLFLRIGLLLFNVVLILGILLFFYFYLFGR